MSNVRYADCAPVGTDWNVPHVYVNCERGSAGEPIGYARELGGAIPAGYWAG